MKEFSFKTRTSNIEKLKSEEFDLLIVGGGITGAGAARDAASRGMKVALVEMQDFAQGTSSRSSKLIHGGVRYLENMEFHLVFEALSERAKLFKIAPTLVHPLRFVIPVFESSRVGMFKLALGMWLYDLLSLFRAPEMHERLNVDKTIQRLPLLQKNGLKGSFVYSDAYMDDDRLVIETLRSANELGAVATNFVKALSPDFDAENKIQSIECEDLLSGEKFKIKAKHFISSVGPWTDDLGHCFFDQWEDMMRPSKGVHLTFARDRLDLQQAVVMGMEERIVFGIPRHEMVIIGTTDTDYQGKIEDVNTDPEDVEYLLAVANEYFPGAKLKQEDIIASYAGVRPLIKDDSHSEGKTSREHAIVSDDRNITFVAGGKYTTYRLMAKQVVDASLNQFDLMEQIQFKASDTDRPLFDSISEEGLRSAELEAPIWAKRFNIAVSDVESLVEKYGFEALTLLENAADLLKTPDNTLKMLYCEAIHAAKNSMCLNLLDFYFRRTHLFLAMPDHGLAYLDQISEVFAEQLGWNESELQSQQQALRHVITSELSWKSNPLD